MVQEFRLPDPGEGIYEAEIVEVCVAVGDTVQEGDILLVIETDKATVEVPSPVTGTIDTIHIQPGDLAHVGDVLVTFSTDGSAPSQLRKATHEESHEGACRRCPGHCHCDHRGSVGYTRP